MKNILVFFFLVSSFYLQAQTEINPKVKPDRDKLFVVAELDKKFPVYQKVARDIWGYAELGFLETQSTERLQGVLRSEGFKIETGVSEMPTAFTATFGSGDPVIGILAEFDALPGLSQDSIADRKIKIEGGPGHACGHHLFGTASVAAARWRSKSVYGARWIVQRCGCGIALASKQRQRCQPAVVPRHQANYF